MKHCAVFLLAILLSFSVQARNDKDKQLPKTEAELINKIVTCLQYKDVNTYATLFINADSVWQMILDYNDTLPSTAWEMSHIRQQQAKVQQFAINYNPDIILDFNHILKKGSDSDVHWSDIALLRYELIKKPLTRDMIGYEKIAPIRFNGYIFIRDMLSRRTYCVTVTDLQSIKGYWYGGRMVNILEASNITDYETRLAAEKKAKKTIKEKSNTDEAITAKNDAGNDNDDNDSDANDEKSFLKIKIQPDEIDADPTGKEVVDRKVYKGTFDNEIPIILYVRYIKGGHCPGGICLWQAIYKFGDQDDYIKLDVSKTPDGKWTFIEDPPIGSMDLVLKNKIYTGNWSSTDLQTGYDVKLTEITPTPKELLHLDKIIEEGAWAKGDEEKNDNDTKKNEDPVIEGVNDN